MLRPKSKPKLFRWLLYYWQAKNLIGFIKNWYLIPLGYFGFISFDKGLTLKLNNGLRFKARHFLEAVGIKEVFIDSDYHLPVYEKSATIIDIGANIGAFSVYAATSSPHVKVISVEPSKSTFETLKSNIQINHLDKQIAPIRAAAWSEVTTLKLYNAGPSGVRSAFQSRGEKKYESVPTITLSEIFRRFNIRRCDFMKIDCEGAEFEILKNCPSNIISKIARISMEFHELNQDQKHQELISILKKNGYKVKAKYHSIENTIGYIYATR